MGISAVSTQRSTATSAQSNQTVTIYTGSGYSVAGSVVKESTNISLGVVTPGQSAAESVVSVSGGPGGPTITSIQYLDANNSISDDTAVDTSGGNILINGSGFVANSTVYINNVAVSNTILSDTQIQATCPAASSGNVSIMIFTSSNAGTIKSDGVRYSGIPSWTTSSVSFQNNQSANVALVASGDSTLTYTLQAGSTLPTGITLNSAGYLEGTVTGYSTTTSSTVVLIATDEENQSTQQTLTWTVLSADAQFNYTSLLLNGDTGSNIVNGANNSVFLDSSTNAATITRAGNVTQGTFSPYSVTGWSNYFDGSGDYLTVGTSPISLTTSTTPFTIEAWVYITAYTGVSIMATNYSSGGIPFWLGLNNGTNTTSGTGGYPVLAYYSGSSWTYVVQSTAANSTQLSLNKWYHIAAIYDGSTAKIFVNGVNTVSNNSVTTWQTTASAAGGINIGRKWDTSSAAYFSGYISNARLVIGTAVYNSNFTPSTTPLTDVTNTKLLTCQSNRFVDNSTNNYTITKNGDVSTQAFSPFAPSSSYTPSDGGGSAYFDGTGDYLTVPNSTGNLSLGSGDFTWEAWIYYTGPAAGGTYGYQVAGPNTGQGSSGWGVVINRNYDTKGFGFVCNNAWVSYSAGFIPTNTWTHLAVTRTGSGSNNFKMFMNGVLTSQTTYTDTDTYTATPVYIGSDGYAANPGSLITGYLSNMRFIKGNSLYTSAFTPPTTPLTAVSNTTLLMNFTNGGIVDAHGTTILETVGDARLSSTQKKYGSNSLYFDGTGDYLNVPTGNPTLQLGTGDFTVEFWMYGNSVSSTCALVDNRNPDTANAGFDISLSSSVLRFTTSGTAYITSGTTLSNGTWYHVALTRSGNAFKLFLNGTQQGTTYTGSSTQNFTNTNLRIGSGANGAFNGYIDDLRITRGFARYTANFTAPENAFIGQ